jgi:hypothetical protein
VRQLAEPKRTSIFCQMNTSYGSSNTTVQVTQAAKGPAAPAVPPAPGMCLIPILPHDLLSPSSSTCSTTTTSCCSHTSGQGGRHQDQGCQHQH